MSALRDEIRAILREEIAALRNDVLQTTETVSIRSSADLNQFAQKLIARLASPGFSEKVSRGEISFVLADRPEHEEPARVNSLVVSAAKATGTFIDKPLVTERDITELSAATKLIRLPKASRLTPLAKDEARRKGIRIERIEE